MADEKKTDAKQDATSGQKAEAPAKCHAPKCKQAVRAKGYCRKHFLAWRREKLGQHHHYKICSKEGCRKRREHGGLCPEHAGKGAPPAEAAPAA